MHKYKFSMQRLLFVCMCLVILDFTKSQSIESLTVIKLKYKTKHGMSLSGQPFLEYFSMSKMKCSTTCGLQGKCLSANYITWDSNAAISKCQLFDFSEKTGTENLEVQQNSTYIEKIIGPLESCDAALNVSSFTDGVYSIVLPSGEYILAMCEKINKKGWIVFQRRFDGKENFDRYRADYEKGFGSVRGEFWLGLKRIYDMVSSKPHTLRVDLWFGEEHSYAEYGTFQLTNKTDDYMLTVADYEGTNDTTILYQRFIDSPR